MAYITSIQHITVTIPTSNTSGTATISSVNTSNTVVLWGGFYTANVGTSAREVMPRLTLTDSTTVTASRNTSSASYTVVVKAVVIEFDSSVVSSVQYGTIAFTTTETSQTATISSVTTSRSVVFYLGNISSTLGQTPTNLLFHLTLTNATTVTAARNVSGSASMTMGFVVVEFQSAVIQSVQARAKTLTSSSTSDTDTISSVTTANTLLIWNGILTGSTGWTNGLYRVTLTNSTTVTLTRTGTATTSRNIRYTVLEFVSGVLDSIERGTGALTATNTSVDSSITAVTTTLAICNYNGHSSDGATLTDYLPSVTLLDTDTVRSERGGTSNATTTGWEVAEFSAGANDNTLTETATVTDSYSVARTGLTTLAESTTPSDTLSASRTASVTLSESQTETDSYTSLIAYPNTLTESLTASDTLTISASQTATRSESSTVTDTQSAARSASVTRSESQTPSDNLGGRSTAADGVTETCTPTDAASGLAVDSGLLTESVAANDNYDSDVTPSPSPAPAPVPEPSPVPGPSDGPWDAYLKWLRTKKRKQFRKKAKRKGIPEIVVERIIEEASQEVAILQPEIKPDYFTPDFEAARNAAQKTILAIYDEIWERMVHEELARIEEEEDEFLML